MRAIVVPAVVLTMLSSSLFAADSVQSSQFASTPVTESIRVIYGSMDLPNEKNRGFRNNAVVIKTSAGFVILDPGGSAYAGEMIAKKIKQSSALPVVAIFNSHAHGDHWLGNEGVRRIFPKADIYGHPKMIARLQSGSGKRWLDDINRVTKGMADGEQVVVPNLAVKHGDVITIGQTDFRVHSLGSAHTDNDIMIEMVADKTLFTGDIVRNGLLGIMEEDASFNGNIDAINYIVAKEFREYIPGHGMVGGKLMVEHYRTYLSQLRYSVKKHFREGLSDYEMKPKVIESLENFKDWRGFDMRIGPHISRAYLEVELEDFDSK